MYPFDQQKCHRCLLGCTVANWLIVVHEKEMTLRQEREVYEAKNLNRNRKKFVEFHQTRHSPVNHEKYFYSAKITNMEKVHEKNDMV